MHDDYKVSSAKCNKSGNDSSAKLCTAKFVDAIKTSSMQSKRVRSSFFNSAGATGIFQKRMCPCVINNSLRVIYSKENPLGALGMSKCPYCIIYTSFHAIWSLSNLDFQSFYDTPKFSLVFFFFLKIKHSRWSSTPVIRFPCPTACHIRITI